MVQIIWTATALNDINDIGEYISFDSVFYAEQFVQKIILAASKLEKHPLIGKPVRELFNYDYREILFKKYRIIYRFENDQIFIISIHHSSRLLSNNDTFKNFFNEDI